MSVLTLENIRRAVRAAKGGGAANGYVSLPADQVAAFCDAVEALAASRKRVKVLERLLNEWCNEKPKPEWFKRVQSALKE